MATVKIKGLKKATARGRTYYYAWAGGPRMKAAFGTPEFLREYADHVAQRKAGDDALISGLITAFKASPRWIGPHPKAYGKETKASWGPWLDKIDAKFGKLMIVNFDKPSMRPLIIDWRDGIAVTTPAAADRAVSTLSVLLSFGMSRGKLMNNLCSGIDKVHSSNRADLIWEPAHLTALEGAANMAIWRAAKLAALTGLRQADLLKLTWRDVQAWSLEKATGKSGGRRSATVPLYGELTAFLATIPKDSIFVLTTLGGQPWGGEKSGTSGFKSSWRTARERAAKAFEKGGGDGAYLRGLDFHDLRGTACTKLYVAGFSVREIAETMAWSEGKIDSLLNRYVRKQALMEARAKRLDANAE